LDQLGKKNSLNFDPKKNRSWRNVPLDERSVLARQIILFYFIEGAKILHKTGGD
jgi:hypothetical protein